MRRRWRCRRGRQDEPEKRTGDQGDLRTGGSGVSHFFTGSAGASVSEILCGGRGTYAGLLWRGTDRAGISQSLRKQPGNLFGQRRGDHAAGVYPGLRGSLLQSAWQI